MLAEDVYRDSKTVLANTAWLYARSLRPGPFRDRTGVII